MNVGNLLIILFHIIKIMWIFLFNTAKVLIFVFVCGRYRRFQRYIYGWFQCWNDPKYPQVSQYLFAESNKSLQTNGGNCAEKLYFLRRLPLLVMNTEPLFAITQRFFSISSSFIPIPLSDTVIVLASLSALTSMRKSFLLIPTFSSVSDR